MLEAARWAPTHHFTEPWKFIVFTDSAKEKLGLFLAGHYKTSTAPEKFNEGKYKKKISNMKKTSHCIAILVDRKVDSKAPEAEELSSVAMAVQNMHLLASDMGYGMYWSSASVFENKHERSVTNPQELRDFLKLSDGQFCIGWLFVGTFDGKWPTSTRKPISTKMEWFQDL